MGRARVRDYGICTANMVSQALVKDIESTIYFYKVSCVIEHHPDD